ncbi:unnamed protein product [Clonostachys solani]|uniref:Phospholipase A2 n=1 Tax=Clonostachys solani TaxID=160281 RepID=A0A9P0EPK9_9HYPO|nr:unnamed protein product [Clonostachys solani]
MKPIIFALILAGGTLATHPKVKEKVSIKKTDDLVFRAALPEFINRRNNQDPTTLDWDSDGCTGVPDKPLEFDFLPACYRHDFAYANYKKQDRLNEVARLKIDTIFQEDLYHQCEKQRKHKKSLCRTYANGYFLGARLLGDLNAKLEPRGFPSTQPPAYIPPGIIKTWPDVKPALDKIELSRENYEDLKNRLNGPAKKFVEDIESKIGSPRPTFQEVKNKIDQLVTVMGAKQPPKKESKPETGSKPKTESKPETKSKPETESKPKTEEPKPKKDDSPKTE